MVDTIVISIWKIRYGLDPTVSDASGDLEHVVFTNIQEYPFYNITMTYRYKEIPPDWKLATWGINCIDVPCILYGVLWSETESLSNDTDSDQWDDGEEYYYWLHHGCTAAEASEYCQTPDIDGDGITDYQEVKGYTVRIITCWNETGAPLHSDREMYGDPLQAYRQSGGSWTDTDADRIPDIVETYFSNTTNINNSRMWMDYTTHSDTAFLFKRCFVAGRFIARKYISQKMMLLNQKKLVQQHWIRADK